MADVQTIADELALQIQEMLSHEGAARLNAVTVTHEPSENASRVVLDGIDSTGQPARYELFYGDMDIHNAVPDELSEIAEDARIALVEGTAGTRL